MIFKLIIYLYKCGTNLVWLQVTLWKVGTFFKPPDFLWDPTEINGLKDIQASFTTLIITFSDKQMRIIYFQ